MVKLLQGLFCIFIKIPDGVVKIEVDMFVLFHYKYFAPRHCEERSNLLLYTGRLCKSGIASFLAMTRLFYGIKISDKTHQKLSFFAKSQITGITKAGYYVRFAGHFI